MKEESRAPINSKDLKADDSKEVFTAIEAAFRTAEQAGVKNYDAVLCQELQKVWEKHRLIVLHMPCSVASGLGD